MARYDPNDVQPQSLSDALKELAEQLAEDYEIPEERILDCLTRITAVYCGDDGQYGDLNRYAVKQIRGAISALGEQDGVRYLEDVDLLKMGQRIGAVECMRSELVPFCSLDELQNQLRNFLKYQDEIEEFLIQTGLPPQKYDESPWLYLQLGRLYDTRCTSSPYPRKQSLPTFRNGHGPLDAEPEQISSSSLPLRKPYDWVTYPTEVGLSPSDIQTCEYKDADFLPGLTLEDANRLEAERPRILATRRAVISEILGACERREGEGLLELCLEILTTKLAHDDILFLLRMDNFYLGGDSRERGQVEVTSKMSPGGLTNLVEVISHVEDELITGRIDRLLYSIPGVGIDLLSDEEVSTAYLQLIHTADAEVIDSALDKFAERVGKTRCHRQEVCSRFATWIDPDYQVPLDTEVQPELSEQISSLSYQVTSLTELVSSWLPKIITNMESQNRVDEGPTPSTESCMPNKFYFDGVTWNITFEGESFLAPKNDGFFYIAELLKTPGDIVHATELRRRINRWKKGDSTALQDKTKGIELGTDGRPLDIFDYIAQNSGKTVDFKVLNSMRKFLEESALELTALRESGQGAEAAQLEAKRNIIQEYIDSSTDNRGNPRSMQPERKKAGDAVRKAIDTAIEKFKKNYLSLHSHLDRSVDRGPTCKYAPSQPVNWEFCPPLNKKLPKP